LRIERFFFDNSSRRDKREIVCKSEMAGMPRPERDIGKLRRREIASFGVSSVERTVSLTNSSKS
jgi:hypothetical protein